MGRNREASIDDRLGWYLHGSELCRGYIFDHYRGKRVALDNWDQRREIKEERHRHYLRDTISP
jgi:hypothetical protein